MGRRALKRVCVDEKTYRAIMETARKTGLSASVLLKLVFVVRVPLDTLFSTLAGDSDAQEVRGKMPLPEALDRALAEAEREIERERREKEKPVDGTEEEEKEQEKPKRIVGDDPKKFFAKKLGIPYFDDKDE